MAEGRGRFAQLLLARGNRCVSCPPHYSYALGQTDCPQSHADLREEMNRSAGAGILSAALHPAKSGRNPGAGGAWRRHVSPERSQRRRHVPGG